MTKYKLMWKIGVEGDKFRPHKKQEGCRYHGCVVMTAKECVDYFINNPGMAIVLDKSECEQLCP